MNISININKEFEKASSAKSFIEYIDTWSQLEAASKKAKVIINHDAVKSANEGNKQDGFNENKQAEIATDIKKPDPVKVNEVEEVPFKVEKESGGLLKTENVTYGIDDVIKAIHELEKTGKYTTDELKNILFEPLGIGDLKAAVDNGHLNYLIKKLKELGATL